MSYIGEAQLELVMLDLLKGIGYDYAFGPEIAHEGEEPGAYRVRRSCACWAAEGYLHRYCGITLTLC
jgi:hypothetical protein